MIKIIEIKIDFEGKLFISDCTDLQSYATFSRKDGVKLNFKNNVKWIPARNINTYDIIILGSRVVMIFTTEYIEANVYRYFIKYNISQIEEQVQSKINTLNFWKSKLF